MLEVKFSGPHALLPNSDDIPLLLASAAAWRPGIYLWTFLFNQAHRVNFVGACQTSLAERHNEHLAEFLGGHRKFHQPEDLVEGKLSPIYHPNDGRDRFVTEFPALMSELSLLRIFFAPFDGPPAQLERIADGIVAHLQRLGGRAADWLDNDPIEYHAKDFDEAFTVRFSRPEFIASMPDEMHL